MSGSQPPPGGLRGEVGGAPRGYRVGVTSPGTLTADLARLLGEQPPPPVVVQGLVRAPAPLLCVDGGEALSWPLSEAAQAALLAASVPAPFGRGGQLVVDPTVRRGRQLLPEQLGELGPGWAATLARIVRQVAEGLGMAPADVRARLHKLLLYEEGGFFGPHRDTEADAAMFGTLVIVLPSPHTGGVLEIRHGEEAVSAALSGQGPGALEFVAFYADCRHELREVRSGLRVCLVYHLLHDRSPRATRAPDEALGALLRRWPAEVPSLRKLVVPLTHHYSEASLAPEHLKGADARTWQRLRGAAEASDVQLSLGLLRFSERGRALNDHQGHVCGPYEVEEHTLEVTPRTIPWALPALPVEAGELSPPDAFAGVPPDEVLLDENRGNEPARFEHRYQRAAAVLWPRAHRFRVQSRLGEGALPLLRTLSPEDAVRLVRELLLDWPRTRYGLPREDRSPTAVTPLLQLLTAHAPEELGLFWSLTAERVYFSEGDVPAVIGSWAEMGWAEAEPHVLWLVRRVGALRLLLVVTLLDQLLREGAPRPLVAVAAQAFLDALPERRSRRRKGPVIPEGFADLLGVVLDRLGDDALAEAFWQRLRVLS